MTTENAALKAKKEEQYKHLVGVATSRYNEILELQSKLARAKETLEFYAGGDKSDIELDIFDRFKCHHNGNSEFDSKWLCKPARQALKEIEG